MKTARYLPALAAALLFTTTAPTAADEWVLACQGGTSPCAIDGTRMIRFGANGVFNYGVATNLFICSGDTFGDPARGVRKSCWYKQSDREQSLEGVVADREREILGLRDQNDALELQIRDLHADLNHVTAELDRIYSVELRRPRPERGPPSWPDRPRRP